MNTVAADPEVAIIHPELRVFDHAPNGYRARWKNLVFMVTVAPEKDGKRWLHASVSRRDKGLPTYDDLLALKRFCVGDHRTALQVFPPASHHFSLRGIEVLHLWCCLDGDVTPDFRRAGQI